MTTIRPIPAPVPPTPGPADAVAGFSRRPAWMRLVIRWPIADLDGRADRWLEWRLARTADDDLLIHAVLHEHGAERTIHAPAAAALTSDPQRSMEHIDLPGALTATLRLQDDGPPVLLFARTPTLAALGIKGGTTDQPQIRR